MSPRVSGGAPMRALAKWKAKREAWSLSPSSGASLPKGLERSSEDDETEGIARVALVQMTDGTRSKSRSRRLAPTSTGLAPSETLRARTSIQRTRSISSGSSGSSDSLWLLGVVGRPVCGFAAAWFIRGRGGVEDAAKVVAQVGRAVRDELQGLLAA